MLSPSIITKANGNALAEAHHLRGHFVLRRRAAAAVADHRELDRRQLVRVASASRRRDAPAPWHARPASGQPRADSEGLGDPPRQRDRDRAHEPDGRAGALSTICPELMQKPYRQCGTVCAGRQEASPDRDALVGVRVAAASTGTRLVDVVYVEARPGTHIMNVSQLGHCCARTRHRRRFGRSCGRIPPPGSNGQPQAGADAASHRRTPWRSATKAFLDRIAEYVKFHHNVEKMVPPLDRDGRSRQDFSARAGAGRRAHQAAARCQAGRLLHQGVPALPAADDQGRLQQAAACRPQGAHRGAAERGQGGGEYDLSVDACRWRPSRRNLLKKLPELPPELEYRIVGRDLILRDVKGNVVVDVMRNVFPIPT